MDTFTKDTINDMRAEIAAKITAGSTLFTAVYPWPKATLDGFPCVIVMPSENDADYSSNIDNQFTFSFTLTVYHPTTKESEYEKTELTVGECVSDLLRIFNQKHLMTTCEWVTPVPSVWGETSVGEATYRTASITLNCRKYMGN